MEVKEAIEKRRAYRSFEPVKITDDLVKDLAKYAELSASCFNNQPWKYVFVYDENKLKEMHSTLSKGNEWGQAASMIIAVCGKKDEDCLMKDGREYYAFDIGMAAAFLILRATELGLVAHPIAGYDPIKAKKILNIPDDVIVVTLIMVGKHSDKANEFLSEKQVLAEKERPPRKDLKEFAFKNSFGVPI